MAIGTWFGTLQSLSKTLLAIRKYANHAAGQSPNLLFLRCEALYELARARRAGEQGGFSVMMDGKKALACCVACVKIEIGLMRVLGSQPAGQPGSPPTRLGGGRANEP